MGNRFKRGVRRRNARPPTSQPVPAEALVFQNAIEEAERLRKVRDLHHALFEETERELNLFKLLEQRGAADNAKQDDGLQPLTELVEVQGRYVLALGNAVSVLKTLEAVRNAHAVVVPASDKPIEVVDGEPGQILEYAPDVQS